MSNINFIRDTARNRLENAGDILHFNLLDDQKCPPSGSEVSMGGRCDEHLCPGQNSHQVNVAQGSPLFINVASFQAHKRKHQSTMKYDGVDNEGVFVLTMGAMGRKISFPRRLHSMVRQEADRHPDIVRWSNDGEAFFVDDEDYFVNDILPQYGFKNCKMQSFQRNLNIYGFSRPLKGPNASGYMHPDFACDVNAEQLDCIISEKQQPV